MDHSYKICFNFRFYPPNITPNSPRKAISYSRFSFQSRNPTAAVSCRHHHCLLLHCRRPTAVCRTCHRRSLCPSLQSPSLIGPFLFFFKKWIGILKDLLPNHIFLLVQDPKIHQVHLLKLNTLNIKLYKFH